MKGVLGVKQTFFEKRRKEWWACGPCSLLFSLRLHDKDVTAKRLLAMIKTITPLDTVKREGMSSVEIQRVLTKYNIVSQVIRYSAYEFEMFFQYLKVFTLKGPVLVFPAEHVIVVVKVEEDKVHFMDPDVLNKLISVVSIERFKEYCLEGTGQVRALYMFPNN